MLVSRTKSSPGRQPSGFTLIELLVVIAIISVLMTVGAIGIGGMTGGVGSAVASAESMFDEARTLAVGNRTRARVLVSRDLTAGARGDDLRRILVAYEALDAQGKPKSGDWVLASRALVLPEQVYFSEIYSTGKNGSGSLDTMTLGSEFKVNQGNYFYYEFNGEGIFQEAGARFVVGTGVKPGSAQRPMVTSSAKRDFGGFVVWRNGRTSMFRNPDQMNIPTQVREF